MSAIQGADVARLALNGLSVAASFGRRNHVCGHCPVQRLL